MPCELIQRTLHIRSSELRCDVCNSSVFRSGCANAFFRMMRVPMSGSLDLISVRDDCFSLVGDLVGEQLLAAAVSAGWHTERRYGRAWIICPACFKIGDGPNA